MRIGALILSFTFSLVSCASFQQPGEDKRVAFEAEKQRLEAQAMEGAISWLAAISQERELDKRLAAEPSGSALTEAVLGRGWKYDADDQEYWAFTLVLAERLDAKVITYAEFDAGRIQKMNEIVRNRRLVQSSEAAAASAAKAAAKAAAPRACQSSTDGFGNTTTRCE